MSQRIFRKNRANSPDFIPFLLVGTVSNAFRTGNDAVGADLNDETDPTHQGGSVPV
jgi:hypothetical protein